MPPEFPYYEVWIIKDRHQHVCDFGEWRLGRTWWDSEARRWCADAENWGWETEIRLIRSIRPNDYRVIKGAIVRSIYAHQISEATGEKDPYTLRLIEYVMKDRQSNLDVLAAPGIKRLAVWAYGCLKSDPFFRELIEYAVPKRSGE